MDIEILTAPYNKSLLLIFAEQGKAQLKDCVKVIARTIKNRITVIALI